MRHYQSGKKHRHLHVSEDDDKVYVEDAEGNVHARLDQEDDDEHELEPTDPSLNALVPSVKRTNASLLVCIGANVGHSYPLVGHEVMIGRDKQNDIILDDRKVSAAHCKIVDVGGTHRLMDLASANGVLVNAARVEATELRHGDLLQIGRSVFRYWIGDPAHGGAEPMPGANANAALAAPASEEWEVVDADVETGLQKAPPPRSYDSEVEYEFRVDVDHRLGGRPHQPLAPDADMSVHELLLQLGRIYAFFRPYWLSILIVAVLGTAAGASSYLLRPPLQSASFEVELTPKAAENPVSEFERSNVEFFRSAEQNFKSPKLIVATLEKLGEPAGPPERIQAIQRNLSFTIVGPHSPNTYVGNFAAEDADFALRFLKTHVDLYLQTEIDKTLKVIQVEADFLQSQLDGMEKELKRTETELLTFKKENIDGLPAQARQYYDYLFELQRQQSQVGKSLDGIQAKLNAGQAALSQQAPVIETPVTTQPAAPFQDAMNDVRRRIAEATALGKGPAHPDVIALNKELEALKKMARSKEVQEVPKEVAVNPQHTRLKSDVAQLQVTKRVTEQEAARLKADYERVKKIVARLPELEAKYADLTRSYDATKALHTRIFEQLKTTLLQLDLERASASARYDIITPPQINYISVPRTIMKRALLGAVLGLLAGLLLAAARQVKKELVL